MARNSNFVPSQIEKDLFQELCSEVIRQKGIDVIYLRREILELDSILNEDIQSKFSQYYTIEAYDEDIYGNVGKGNFQGIYGSAIFDKKNISISRKTWQDIIGNTLTGDDSKRPKEGDLIYIPLKKSLYQISFVEHEDPYYNLEFNPFYRLTLDLFEYSNDIIDTGDVTLDNFQNFFAYSITMKISSGSGNFAIGDEVYQNTTFTTGNIVTNTITGRVSNISIDSNPSKRIITITNIQTDDSDYQTFVSSNDPLKKLFREDNSVSWIVEKVYNIDEIADISEKDKILPTNKKSSNAEVQLSANALITKREKDF